ncbi:amidohydrolase family protein [Streptomyces sp. NRRL F-5135]|uniref:amidohydrolase family protein n=1 Tax=Streptomyces sp. NRRL F-5135 TaxID=1463858 RepID=UPI0007C55E79|nr:amidohydrolase family protein [Streptomyces sp. NRRL F-5135]
MRTDVHAHLWTEDYLTLLESFGRRDTAVQHGMGATDSTHDLQARFAMNAAAGIDHQILSVSPQGPYFPDAEQAVRAARLANDHYADLIRAWPTRLSAFAALPLPHLDQSLAELARALDELDLAGVAVTTDVLGRGIADPAFSVLFEELDRRGSVLSVHPSGHDAGSPLIAATGTRWMIGAPVEDTVCAMHFMIEGIPNRFPRLRVVHSHLGGALPMLLSRADALMRREAPRMTEKPTVTATRMWYDTVAHGHVPALRAAAGSYGADRLVFGTDFPYQSGERLRRAVSFIKEALPPDEAEQVLTAGTRLLHPHPHPHPHEAGGGSGGGGASG